jgi:predicted anti-sigma-YlaC factor YlaD
MRCERFREAISARIDGEDPGLPDGALDAHLEACAECRGWQQRAHVITRRARLGGSFLDHDLTSRVLAAAPAASAGRRRRVTQRAGLAAMTVAQLAITVPLLLLGHDHDAGAHAAHELGSFDLALAIAFAVGAIRPALAAGLAWPCAIAAAGLTGTAVADLIGGQTPGADEAQHLVALAGALLLIWQARTNGGRPAEATADAFGPVPANTVPANTVPANTVPANTVPANTVPANTVPVTTGPVTVTTARPDGTRDGGTPAAHGGAEAVA